MLPAAAWKQYLYLFDLMAQRSRGQKKFEDWRRQHYMSTDRTTFDQLPAAEVPLYCIIHNHVLTTVPIKECGDPLIDLVLWLQSHHSRISCLAGVAQYGAVDANMRLRQAAAKRLLHAEASVQAMIGPEYSLKLTDAFRPVSLQRKYFTEVMAQICDREQLTGQALYQRVTQLLADPDKCAPHTTGGVIDLTIVHTTTGQELDMGTAIDEIDNELIYFWHPALQPEQRRHRLILYTAMRQAGFSNSPSEWWHYGYGDQEWTLRSHQPAAIYGSFDQSEL